MNRSIGRQVLGIGAVVVSALTCGGCGVLGTECSGLSALLCGEGLYCKFDDGSCGEDGETGTCAERPEACTLIFAPVCGCDGETYDNECQAAAAGVSVRDDGPCTGDDDEQICGGLAGFACDDGEFCQFPEGTCGAADETGVCKDIPDVCTEEFAPVCGCDEETYDNLCFASRAGVSILHEGACDSTGIEARVCGGIIGEPCLEGEFCRLPEGQCCCDIQGICEVLPEVCTLEFDPVCGCDGVTYGNECEASRAGVSVDHRGECEAIGNCGGLQGLPCDDREYCQFPEGTCGAADQMGTCTAVPEVCTDIFDPVCGCDDATYANECEAARASVSLVHRGECEPAPRECGGLLGLPCEDGEYCQFPEGTCGAADQTGACTAIPEACTDIFDPVCGCDDATYANECEASRAGVSVLSRGECP